MRWGLFVLSGVIALSGLSATALAGKPKKATSAAKSTKSVDPGADAGPALDAGAADDDEEAQAAKQMAEFEAALSFQTGKISLVGGKAVLDLPEGYRYLGPADTEKVLVAWGNPPGQKNQGMILPKDMSVFGDDSWAVLVDYMDDGHVDDSDAASIDYAQLLVKMREASAEDDRQRKAQGLTALELVGWAEPPHYDSSTKKIYWAKDLKAEDQIEHTINYAVRVLGREGILELNAIASAGQLASVKSGMATILGFSEFTPGNRYADYKEGSDRSAGYGIAAVVGGGVALKAIGTKGFWAILLGAKKLLIAGAIALAAGLKKLFGWLSNRRAES